MLKILITALGITWLSIVVLVALSVPVPVPAALIVGLSVIAFVISVLGYIIRERPKHAIDGTSEQICGPVKMLAMQALTGCD